MRSSAEARRALSVTGGALTPCAAWASGDPGVIWSIAGAIGVQIIVGTLMARLAVLRPFRKPMLTVYVMALIPAWIWGLNVPGPDFGHVDALLIGGPIVFLIGATFMARLGR